MYIKIGKEKRKINKKKIKLLITLNIQSKHYILKIIRSLFTSIYTSIIVVDMLKIFFDNLLFPIVFLF